MPQPGLSRAQLYHLAFLLCPLIYFLSLPITVEDLAGWTAIGLRTVAQGHLLRADVFSVYPTREWVYAAGVTVLYALFFKVGGLVAVSLLHKAVWLAILVVVYRASLARLAEPWTARNLVFVALFFVGTSVIDVDRPAMLALLPLLIGYLILDRPTRLGWADWAGLCVLNLAWNNVHGSAVVLLAMALWRLVARRHAADLLGAAVLGASYVINPFGTRIASYLLETREWSKNRLFEEWARTTPLTLPPQGALFWAVALGLLAVVAMRARKAWLARSAGGLEILKSPIWVLVALGFDSIRNTPFVFLVLLPFAARYGLLSDGPARRPAAKERRLANAVVGGFLVAYLVAVLPFVKPYAAAVLPEAKAAVFDGSAPFKVADYLRSSPKEGAVFNGALFGSFLMLMQPRKIFFDFRNIIYSDATLAEYTDLLRPTADWEAVLARRGARFLVLDRGFEASGLLSVVTRSPRWRFVLDDGRAVLFERIDESSVATLPPGGGRG